MWCLINQGEDFDKLQEGHVTAKGACDVDSQKQRNEIRCNLAHFQCVGSITEEGDFKILSTYRCLRLLPVFQSSGVTQHLCVSHGFLMALWSNSFASHPTTRCSSAFWTLNASLKETCGATRLSLRRCKIRTSTLPWKMR